MIRLMALLLLLIPSLALADSTEIPNGTVSVGTNSDCSTSTAHGLLDEDPDTPGGDWCEATDDGSDHIIMLNLTDPGTLDCGTDVQSFAVFIKIVVDDQGTTPTIALDVYDGVDCADVHELGVKFDVTNTTGQLIVGTWTANGISSEADVCVRLDCSRSGGSPTSRRACSFDAVEWRAVTGAGCPTGGARRRLWVIQP